MYKGKYVLLSMKELKNKISTYLESDDFNLKIPNQENDIINENSTLFLDLSLEDENKFSDILTKIAGPSSKDIINSLVSDFNIKKDIILDMTDCSFMLSKIFEIDEPVSFDSEVTFANEDKDLYLYYVNV